jgi:hypothetical protein
VFSSGWSVYSLRKVLLSKEILILSGKNQTILKLKKNYLFNNETTPYICISAQSLILKGNKMIFFGIFEILA